MPNRDAWFHAYVAAVALLAALACSALDWNYLIELPGHHQVGVSALVILGIVSEYLAIPLVVGKNQGSHSVIFLLQFAAVLTLGPAATAIATFAAFSASQLFMRRSDWPRAIFNVAQHTLAAALAGLLFGLLGGTPSPDALSVQVLPFVAFGVTLTTLNLLAVSIGISIHEGLTFANVVSRLSGGWGANILYDIVVAPIAVLIAFFYNQFWVTGLIGVLFVLLFVRRAYLINFQLQQANRDLLKVLVKAIETRDPYTSGHSVRVASLAAHVAKRLGLSNSRVRHIETAALLHDVGKIDAIYTGILTKRGGLSSEELEIIKSHVDKGVELLTSLSSFHNDVISAVRHHHERFDGSGYPDGLSGQDIPMGARIIKICDAVDAMLSDRPYRKALSLPDVREQLMLFAEREFDPHLVSVFFKEGWLEGHQAAVQRDVVEPAFSHADPTQLPVQLTLAG